MNVIEIKDDHALMLFKDRKGNSREERVIIDIDSIPLIENFGKTFSLRKCKNNWYAVNSMTDLYLHKLIFGEIKKGNVVDHKNQNSLDCRKQNLREATYQTNSINSRGYGKTKIRGVYPHSDGGYVAQVGLNGKPKYLGTFKTIELATQARNAFVAGMGV